MINSRITISAHVTEKQWIETAYLMICEQDALLYMHNTNLKLENQA